MIGKVMTGKSFGGCVAYNVDKAEAKILYAEGVRIADAATMTRDFNMQRKLNPELGNAVGHIALSWSSKDQAKLNPELMVTVAREYLQKMKIRDTQLLIVRHQDKQHPHIHIVYNRVNNQGKTISDQFQKRQNGIVCKELTLKHGFYLASGKENVNRGQLKGADQVKYQLFDAISKAIKQAKDWNQLEQQLKRENIGIVFKYKSGSSEIQGISFSKNEITLKGSQIDRSLSYGRISQALQWNQQHPGEQNGHPQNRNNSFLNQSNIETENRYYQQEISKAGINNTTTATSQIAFLELTTTQETESTHEKENQEADEQSDPHQNRQQDLLSSLSIPTLALDIDDAALRRKKKRRQEGKKCK